MVSREQVAMSGAAKTQLRKEYEKWGQYVSRGESPGARRRRRLTTALVSGDRVLEIGCAEGWMSQQLIRPGRLLISGDVAAPYLVRTRRNAPGAHLASFDAHALPFAQESFDCVVCTQVLEHVSSPFEVLLAIHRVLEPGGDLVLSVPNSMTTTHFLRHLLGQAVGHSSHPTDAHLTSFEPAGLVQLLSMAGFLVSELQTSHVHIPLVSRWLKVDSKLQDILCRRFRLVGQHILVVAKSEQARYWRELDEHYEAKFTHKRGS